jgi:hypothetical protein
LMTSGLRKSMKDTAHFDMEHLIHSIHSITLVTEGHLLGWRLRKSLLFQSEVLGHPHFQIAPTSKVKLIRRNIKIYICMYNICVYTCVLHIHV